MKNKFNRFLQAIGVVKKEPSSSFSKYFFNLNPVVPRKMSFSEFLELIGTDEFNSVAIGIYKALEINGFKIVKDEEFGYGYFGIGRTGALRKVPEPAIFNPETPPKSPV